MSPGQALARPCSISRSRTAVTLSSSASTRPKSPIGSGRSERTAPITHDLEAVALTLVADGKGLLAADETPHTLTHRFDTLGIQSTEKSRRTYRKMLFTAGAADFISRVILQDENDPPKQLRRHAARQNSFATGHPAGHQGRHTAPSRSRGAPGENRHRRARRVAGSPVRVPRDGGSLREMARGDRMSSDMLPSTACIGANAHALARYAALCQETDPGSDRRAGSADGWMHTRIEYCEAITGTGPS